MYLSVSLVNKDPGGPRGPRGPGGPHVNMELILLRMSFDPARYPRYIPEAYCLCRGCLLGPRGEESRLYRSAPVFAPSAILRRAGSCAGGRHAYTELYVSIAVGCTCLPLPKKERDGNRSLEPRGRRLWGPGAPTGSLWRCGLLINLWRTASSQMLCYLTRFHSGLGGVRGDITSWSH